MFIIIFCFLPFKLDVDCSACNFYLHQNTGQREGGTFSPSLSRLSPMILMYADMLSLILCFYL